MSIKASNNPFPHDPDDNWKQKLERGGYPGTAKDLDDKINTLKNPDAFLIRGPISKLNNLIVINALEWKWRINQIEFTNQEEYSTIIAPASVNHNRIDIIVATKFGTFVKVRGDESVDSAKEPDIPPETLKVTFISVFGEDISVSPEPIDSGSIPYLSLVRIAKGVGNIVNLDKDEPGDIFEGFKDATTYWTRARWNGGDRGNRNNYTPIVEHEL